MKNIFILLLLFLVNSSFGGTGIETGVVGGSAAGGGGGTPGGSNTQVQFNDSGAFGGDAEFTYNSTTDTLTIGTADFASTGIGLEVSAGVIPAPIVQFYNDGTSKALVPLTNIAFSPSNTYDIGIFEGSVTYGTPRYIYPGTAILNVGGTAALPSYSFNGDLNTGVYSSAADTVNISTGGTLRASVTNSGLNLANTTASKFLVTDASNNVVSSTMSSSFFLTVSAKSSNYPIVAADHLTVFLADTSGGAFSFTNPTPVSGYKFCFKDPNGSWGTNNLTIIRAGSEKIENVAASKVLSTNFGYVCEFSDGTDWYLE